MKRTLEQKADLVRKITALKENGSTHASACKEFQIAPHDFYRFRNQVGKLNDSAVREIKHVNNGTDKMLKAENTRLRTLVVNLSLDVQALKEYRER